MISSHKDTEALTLTFVAEFEADVTRVWQLWADPRQLERWWGPPGWPATYDRHDFVVGGTARYHLAGPDGEKPRGWWRFTAIDAPHRLEFDTGLAGDDGEPLDPEQSTHGVMTLEQVGNRTRMTAVSTFRSQEQLEQMVAMGMEEGQRLSMGQMDALLTAQPALD